MRRLICRSVSWWRNFHYAFGHWHCSYGITHTTNCPAHTIELQLKEKGREREGEPCVCATALFGHRALMYACKHNQYLQIEMQTDTAGLAGGCVLWAVGNGLKGLIESICNRNRQWVFIYWLLAKLYAEVHFISAAEHKMSRTRFHLICKTKIELGEMLTDRIVVEFRVDICPCA